MARSEGKDNGSDKDSTGRDDNKPRIAESGRVKISRNEEIILDKWQLEVLKEIEKKERNLTIRAGRQVGKSTVISIGAGQYAVYNKNKSIMIISSTERQAYLLFSKVLSYLYDNYKWAIKMGKDRPTKTEIKLTNGSVIRCLPTGLDGLGIRGYTINLLIADEAAFINEDVWPAVTPMLATTGGKIILLSTPMGKDGYFYKRFNDDNFLKWHINAEDVAETREEPQRTNMRDFQEEEKKSMTQLQYAQEYLGEFVDDLRRLFPDELIRKICILKKNKTQIIPNFPTFLGVDIARLGADSSSFQVLQKLSDEEIVHVYSELTQKTLTTETYDRIINLDRSFHLKKIGIDAGSGSLGVGIMDWLLRSEVKRKVIALNNLGRALDHRGEKKKTLLKEDMYLNLLAMMERGIIKLLEDEDLILSLRAIQYEYQIKGKQQSSMKVFAAKHQFTDYVEGLIRAAYLANQKNINTRLTWI